MKSCTLFCQPTAQNAQCVTYELSGLAASGEEEAYSSQQSWKPCFWTVMCPAEHFMNMQDQTGTNRSQREQADRGFPLKSQPIEAFHLIKTHNRLLHFQKRAFYWVISWGTFIIFSFVESFPGVTPNVLRQMAVSKGWTEVEGSLPAGHKIGSPIWAFQKALASFSSFSLSNLPDSFTLFSLMVSTWQHGPYAWCFWWKWSCLNSLVLIS